MPPRRSVRCRRSIKSRAGDQRYAVVTEALAELVWHLQWQSYPAALACMAQGRIFGNEGNSPPMPGSAQSLRSHLMCFTRTHPSEAREASQRKPRPRFGLRAFFSAGSPFAPTATMVKTPH